MATGQFTREIAATRPMALARKYHPRYPHPLQCHTRRITLDTEEAVEGDLLPAEGQVDLDHGMVLSRKKLTNSISSNM